MTEDMKTIILTFYPAFSKLKELHNVLWVLQR